MYARTLLRFLYPKTKRKQIFLLVAFAFIVTICWNYYSFLHFGYSKSRYKNIESNLLDSKKVVNRNFFNHDSIKHSLQTDVDIKALLNTPDDASPRLISALVFTDSDKANGGKKSKLKSIFLSMKINYDFLTWNRLNDNFLVFPRLHDNEGYIRYHIIIFTSHRIFEDLDSYSRKLLYDHCQAFNVGMVILADAMHTKGATQFHSLSPLPLSIKTGVMCLKDLEVAHSELLKITKPGNILRKNVHGKRHAIFASNHSTFQPVLYSMMSVSNSCRFTKDIDIGQDSINANSYVKSISIIYDKGEYDGVRKAFFGTPIFNSFLHTLVFIDSLHTLSNGYVGYDLNRYIQIDIDDIFVGSTNKKLVRSDVEALVESQRYLASHIAGFKYYLGYSGAFYQNSNNSAEVDGDRALVEHASEFKWFCHTYHHTKPHMKNTKELIHDFQKNQIFAVEQGIKVDPTYSVAPHHSGVYPTHDSLYDAWKDVWNIKVTSTEGYPHLYPASGRKGFLYKDILVLPRQTCGLFTTTLHNAQYPKGSNWLKNSAYGGELFWTVIFNPVNIFMTHQGNYGFEERLAIHLFKNVTKFIQTWTSINLQSLPPVELAAKYFELFPKQLDPIWEDPCMDLRHQKIWNGTTKYCNAGNKSRIERLPNVLIIGPQKTGTTALLSFLTMHPQMIQSRYSKHAFEEAQFFNRDYYMRGISWYMSFFPEVKVADTLNFEKSANYLDSVKAPIRAFSLLPNAKLIIIASDPKLRAYSWYQHMYSKREPVALNHTFFEVLTLQNKTYSMRFSILHKRCLTPGLYAESLERWLQYYKPSQIYLVDGYELREKPHLAMKKLSDFLKIAPFPFDRRIRYNDNKGFFCATGLLGEYKCLGSSKGRIYPPMSDNEFQFLTDYYRIPNLRLVDLLVAHHIPLPRWLSKEFE